MQSLSARALPSLRTLLLGNTRIGDEGRGRWRRSMD